MRIIIEGADLTGKSTLANKFVKEFGLSYIHSIRKDPNDFPFYLETLRKEDVVFDRHFIGEMIYPTIFNRKQNLDKNEFNFLLNKAKNMGYIIIVTYATEEQIKERLKERPDEPHDVIDNIYRINQMFIDIASEYDILLINTEQSSYEEIKEALNIG